MPWQKKRRGQLPKPGKMFHSLPFHRLQNFFFQTEPLGVAEAQALLQKLQSAPDIRPRAEEIKVAVDSGTYKVSPKQVAEAIIRAQKGR